MADQKTKKVPVLEIAGQRIAGTPHVSRKTGSLGHIFNAKVVLEDGTRCQFNGNLTVVGSADPERAAQAQAASATKPEASAPAKS